MRIIGGILLDKDYQLITKEQALEIILNEKEVVCKPSLEIGSGRGISFWETETEKSLIEKFINDKENKDYIIQKTIIQHPELDRVHKGSVNSLRIVSLLMPENVYILSSNLRMGVQNSRIDNVSAGGISCGINKYGKLKKYATYAYTGDRIEQHPQGLLFDGFEIPCYQKAVDIVKRLATLIPHFRLVSWDIAIDQEGEPVLIEANMRKGMINLNQFNNGPLFGDLTDRVLDEVFKK